MKTSIEIRILFCSVVVIAELWCGMPVELIEPLDFGAIRFGISINGIAIERVGDRFVFANDPLQMRGSNVIVIVVATTAVAAEFV